MIDDDLDLVAVQDEVCAAMLQAVISEAARLTLDRRKPTLDEVRDVGIVIGRRMLADQEARFPLGSGVSPYNLTRSVATQVDHYAQGRGCVVESIAGFALGAVRFRTDM